MISSRKHKQYVSKLVDIEIALQESVVKERKADEQIALAKINNDPKYFYSYAKRCKTIKHDIGPLMNSDGMLTCDNQEMGNILNNQYLPLEQYA